VPDEVDEAMRDLTRAKQRLKAFLLRHGYRYSGKANWSEPHQHYLRELVLPIPSIKAVREE
jgi:phage antirepressor YoqD-like protein